jgi:lactate dehydrogenase-like 2-hydroxyacid dehydrogenase
MRERIVAIARLPQHTLDVLRQRFEVLEAWHDVPTFLKTYRDTAALRVAITIGNRALTREMIALLPALRYVCHYGVGCDRIDVAALAERGVLLTNTAGSNSTSVAELAIFLLGSCVRRICPSDRAVRMGAWANGSMRRQLAPQLAGRKLGIYGFGHIGSKIAQRATGFEMDIGYYCRTPKQAVTHRFFSSLLALAAWSDDLVVAVDATAATERSVNAAVLAALGPHGFLVNVARGSVVAEDDLVVALESGTIAGAGLDVYANEPSVPKALIEAMNVVLTPHMASDTEGAVRTTDQMFFDNLERYFAGLPPQNTVVP